MNLLRRSLTATALIGTGLACTTGAAFAGDGHHGDRTEQTGLVNVSDTQTIVPVNACGNNVPVNALGVQVPVQDVAGNVPILSSVEKGSEQGAGISESCANAVEADN
ncbi:hypothetical protein [Actinomycetospora straminea]|uniref:Small secreted domain DUF320 n=1 Tax=Actinomycetospora straminea TaxID=663607 RepID=A0ABP9EA49_9PSEU|nr:hypothetical protein [Actinomycetospora straminea]MDD7934623.1 hypothetical protein [Actinomycetospora straminea]